MQVNSAIVDQSMRELTAHGSPDYPLKVYQEYLPKSESDFVQQHWHPEVELVLVTEGAMESRIGENRVTLHAGDGIFINSGILHGERGLSRTGAKISFILFSATAVARGSDLIYSKYVLPVVKNAGFPFLSLTWEHPWQMDLLNHISSIISHENAHTEGYELAVINELGVLWHTLISSVPAMLSRAGDRRNDQQDQRVKQMIDFIDRHYTEPITLAAIAQAANISPRECQRCFLRALGTAPVDYLIGRRLEAAAQALRTTTQSVSDIALSCGFNSSSYFTKRFRQMYGKPPLAYRHQAANT